MKAISDSDFRDIYGYLAILAGDVKAKDLKLFNAKRRAIQAYKKKRNHVVKQSTVNR